VTVASPCRAACRLNDDRRFCVSCGRLLTHIVNWSTMSDYEKKAAKKIAEDNLGDLR